MRLNAYLARAGVASRRKADELIKAGRVTVNGEPGQLNTFVAARDRVELDGQPLARQPLAYVLLHKPSGVVTTASDPHGRTTVVELVAEHGTRVVPVGRLDADTTGALLLTNDGELAHRLAHPRYEVEKVYEADVEGERTIADAGGTLVGVYVTLGRYDVVEIFEAPDDETAAEIIMKLQRHGAEHTETLRAFTRDEAEEIIRRV